MAKKWKLPLLSKLAWFVARKLPNRVAGVIWLEAYEELEKHYRAVWTEENDCFEHFDAVSAVRIESLRRKVFREFLKAEAEER